VTAAADGTYTTPAVPAGTYTVNVSLADYDAGVIEGVTVTNATVTGKDLVLIETNAEKYTVGGTITKGGGNNAEGATVQLKKSGTPIGGAVTAAADGTYTTPEVPAGEYTVEVTLTGYTTYTATVTVSADITDKDLQLTATVYTISYTLNDEGNTVTNPNPATYTIESAAITLADPSRSGDTFEGWYNNALFSGAAVTGIPAGSTGHKAFYAKWGLTAAEAKAALQNAISAAAAAKVAITVGTAWTEATECAPGAIFTGTAAASLPPGLYYLAANPVPDYETAITAAQTAYENATTAAALSAATAALQTAGVTFNTALAAKAPGTRTLAARITAATTGATLRIYAGETFQGVLSPPNIDKTLTLEGVGAERIIQLTGQGNMFYLGSSSAKLTLAGSLTLRGVTNNYQSLVEVADGGTFTMKGDAKVSGNTATTTGGGGVFVNGSGSSFAMQDNAAVSGNTATGIGAGGGGVFVTGSGSSFTMEDNAAVSGNTANRTTADEFTGGGGVYFNGGTFTMQDSATVSGNNATGGFSTGGGVFVNGGTFTMEDNAAVSGNTTTGRGGGVYVSFGTFTIEGDAVISGNTAGATGGGVYYQSIASAFSFSIFIKTGGTIYGNTGDSTRNTAGGGGHAIYLDHGNFRHTTVGSGVVLFAWLVNTNQWTYNDTSLGLGDTTDNW
jgi:uncharacterized repeat protein (TIGR02543 family)